MCCCLPGSRKPNRTRTPARSHWPEVSFSFELSLLLVENGYPAKKRERASSHRELRTQGPCRTRDRGKSLNRWRYAYATGGGRCDNGETCSSRDTTGGLAFSGHSNATSRLV